MTKYLNGRICIIALAVLVIIAMSDPGRSQHTAPQLVTFMSGDLRLKGFPLETRWPWAVSSDLVESRFRKDAGRR
jgi:hypothetical protein